MPDVTAFADWPNAPYQDFSTEHINFFSPVSLDNLMRRHGFTRGVPRAEPSRAELQDGDVEHVGRLPQGPRRPAASLEFDGDTARGLERYIAQCATRTTRGCARRSTPSSMAGRRILVWGVGTHTSRLMATSRLAEADIVAFVESNARYHGKTLHGRPILAPEALKEHHEPVLISSRVFQKEIAEQIRNGLGCSNELILLYNV